MAEVCRLLAEGKRVTDPELLRRVEERAAEEVVRTHGRHDDLRRGDTISDLADPVIRPQWILVVAFFLEQPLDSVEAERPCAVADSISLPRRRVPP